MKERKGFFMKHRLYTTTRESVIGLHLYSLSA